MYCMCRFQTPRLVAKSCYQSICRAGLTDGIPDICVYILSTCVQALVDLQLFVTNNSASEE